MVNFWSIFGQFLVKIPVNLGRGDVPYKNIFNNKNIFSINNKNIFSINNKNICLENETDRKIYKSKGFEIDKSGRCINTK